VKNGVVTLEGTPETPSIGRDVRTGIRRVDGGQAMTFARGQVWVVLAVAP
jgi:hypothetical protein